MIHLTLLEKYAPLVIVKNQIMISFDVDGLQTNISVHEAINITLNMIYKKQSPPSIPFNCPQLKQLL